MPALIGTLGGLALAAKTANIGLTVDAEEADRLELCLDIFSAVLGDPMLAGWNGLGIAVQAYQKRALPLIDWLAEQGRRTRHRIPTRLVKGAYRDSEIKQAQVQGHPDYPVFTRKAATDVSWLACARRMLECGDAIATPSAHAQRTSIWRSSWNARAKASSRCSACMAWARRCNCHDASYPVRVYAPVGSHEDLLAYLVRRLLENGANTSFVHRLVDPSVPEQAIVADPVARLRGLGADRNPRIPLPRDLYPDRRNSAGVDLADPATAPALFAAISPACRRSARRPGHAARSRNPADPPRSGRCDRRRRCRRKLDAELDVLCRAWLA